MSVRSLKCRIEDLKFELSEELMIYQLKLNINLLDFFEDSNFHPTFCRVYI